MNAPIIYINNLSSVPVELNLFDSTHNLLDPIAVSFRFVYIDRKKTRYEVEHRIANDTQSEYFKNCFIENGRLFIRFESTGFTTGRLERELWLTQELIPDKGEGFTNDEIKYILTETSAIEIISGIIPADCSQTNQYKKGSIIGIETIIFPCIEYTGTTSTQAEIIVNDFIHNKSLIAGAINAKGGEADKTDSAAKLADSILNLIPAQPIFATSGNLNPRWTDLQAKIAEHYRDDRQHAWAFSFLGDNQTVELTGGDYYICSDGYEADQSEAHTFGANLDENKTDNWVIIYTQTPVFVFPGTLFVLGAAFYNTSPELVNFYSTKIVFVSQAGGSSNDVMTLPSNFLRSTGISYFFVPDGVEGATIGNYAFDNCRSLIDLRFPVSIKNISFGSYAGQYLPAVPTVNNVLYPDLENITIGTYAFQHAGFNQNSVFEIESKESIVMPGTTSTGHHFAGTTAGILRLKSKVIQASGSYLVQNSTVKRVELLATESLSLSGYYTFASTALQELYLKCPNVALNFGTSPFTNSSLTNIELESGWNRTVNLSAATNQNSVSMYQNVQALADRTGQTALTLTFGSAKLNALLTAHPDAATIASSKNWNLA